MCTRANFGYFSTYELMRLIICRSVFIGEDNILTKFRANPMHVVHAVHVHKCARGQILAIFRLMRLKSYTTRTKRYGFLDGLQEGSLSEACFCRDIYIITGA